MVPSVLKEEILIPALHVARSDAPPLISGQINSAAVDAERDSSSLPACCNTVQETAVPISRAANHSALPSPSDRQVQIPPGVKLSEWACGWVGWLAGRPPALGWATPRLALLPLS